MQPGDLEQIVDIRIQIDEFQRAAALSSGGSDADEGPDADTIHQAHLTQVHEDWLALLNKRAEGVVTFVLRNAFSPRPHIYPQNRMRRLESVSGAANARLRWAAVMVNGCVPTLAKRRLGWGTRAAAIFENQRPNKFPP